MREHGGGDDRVAEHGGGRLPDTVGSIAHGGKHGGILPHGSAAGGNVSAGGEPGDEHVTRVDMVLLRILADVADSQRRLDQRGAVMCLVLNGVIENKHVQSGGEVLQRDRLRLAVGEELVAAARANDDGAANRDIQLRRGSVYIRDYGAVRVFWGQHEGFGSHW